MLHTLSDIIGVSTEKLKNLGVLNVYLGIDSEYYINIKLLEKTNNPFFLDAYRKVKNHFIKLFKFLSNSKCEGDSFWKAAYILFYYPEINEISIGLANGIYGKGLTSKAIRTQALRNAKEIIESGFVDEDIFLYVGMFTDKVGLDLISDMISNIIIENIKEYTKYINKECGINAEFLINPYKNKNIYYLPLEILTEMPVTKWLKDIDYCIQKNNEARNIINELIGEEWKKETTEIKKRKFIDILCCNHEVYQKYKECYDSEMIDKYDFDSDKIGYASLPNIVATYFDSKANSVKNDYDSILEFVNYFKNVIEYNNASMLIYDNGKLRHEKFAQVLFHVCALNYFKNGEFEISPESNAGRGPVDFKLKGSSEKILVEIKKLSSRQIYHGIEVQLIEYAKSENTKQAIYVVLDDMNESEKKNKKIQKIYDIANGSKIQIKVVVIDCKSKDSASIY